ncbi:hypothetical protein Tco_0653500 [Tanacetum coccineum]|uniref:Uncharacterized protein n=1 Tax=Tanacetum coccineum TaxID=301880 RepID=A0ABQ4X0K1_9ASTR
MKHFAGGKSQKHKKKTMTQSQLRAYMSTYLKNQGTWKLAQLKKLTFDEVKAGFEKLVRQIDAFVPMSFEATKESLKRFGIELQAKTAKRPKVDDKDAQSTKKETSEAKKDEATEKKGKRRKQMARKGVHTEKDETEKDEEEVPIDPVPVATKPPSIVTYKIIKQGKKGVYQIIRAYGTAKIYINFGAMLKDITRDDLTELFRIVMQRYGLNEPEDDHEKIFWGYLKNMFDAPLSTDVVWSLPGQQKIINWVYYDACKVHCLNLDSAEIYTLIERSYPLSADVCKDMLHKKLQGGIENKDCYKLLKLMEKQAGMKE